MNKYQQALSDIYVKTNCEYSGMTDDIATLLELVIRATPKKPHLSDKNLSMYNCPNCESTTLNGGDDYCIDCGQALDWSK